MPKAKKTASEVPALIAPSDAPQAFAMLTSLVSNQLTSLHSKRAYTNALTAFFNWFGTSKMFNWLYLQEYRAYMLRKKLSPATINLRLAAVRKLAEVAWLANMIPPEDYQKIRKIPNVKEEGTRLGTWLSKEQAEKLLAAPNALQHKRSAPKRTRDRAILAVCLGCGLRRAEVCDLNCGHVRFVEGVPALVDIKGKGNKTRTIPMGDWCYKLVDEWINVLKKEGLHSKDTPLFTHVLNGKVSNERLTPETIYKRVKEYCDQVGIGDISPHDLRRTFSRLAKQGQAEIYEIQKSLGHSSVATTERYLGGDQSFTESPGQSFMLNTDTDD